MKKLLAVAALLAACDKKAELQDKGKQVIDAAQKAIEIKRDFDKVYKNETDYDLVVSAEPVDDAKVKEHEAKIEAMPHVKINGVSVGYVESDERSIKGVTYEKHYRASWCRNGKYIGIGYYSNKQIDAAEFVKLLEKLVPIVEKHV